MFYDEISGKSICFNLFVLSVCRDVEKKGFVDPVRNLIFAQIKPDQTDRSRTPTGKDVHLHRLYLDPHSKARLTNTQVCSCTVTSCAV